MTSTPPDPAFWAGLFDFSFTRYAIPPKPGE
jgi:hypothetical protein